MRTEDDLRTALRTPIETETLTRLTAFVHDIDDIDELIEPARRLPRRRMAWMAVAAACAIVALVGLLVALTSRQSRQPAGGQPSPPSNPAAQTRSPAPATSFDIRSTVLTPSLGHSAAKPQMAPNQEVVGNIVRTKVAYGQQNLALWIGIGTHGELMLSGGHLFSGHPVTVFSNGYMRPSGGYRCDVTTSADAAPSGFYCGYDASIAANSTVLVGYVIGDVATVKITVDGQVHRAQTAAWSNGPRVHLWWLALPAPKTGLAANVSTMVALDASGKVVARTSGGIAHG